MEAFWMKLIMVRVKEFLARNSWKELTQSAPNQVLPMASGPKLKKIGKARLDGGRLVEAELSEGYVDAIELIAIGIAHIGDKGRFIYVNKHLCKMLGYEKKELLKLTVKDISHPEDIDITDTYLTSLHTGEVDSFKLEKRYLKKDRMPIWVSLTIATKRRKDGSPLYDVSLVEDISSRKKAEERVRYLASYDDMTSLPNRVYFNRLLGEAVKYARRYDRKIGIIFIDLDRFKHINDSLGHFAGDQLLVGMAARYKKRLRSSDIVARLGGDEFVVLIHEVESKNIVETVAEDLLSITKKPFKIKGKDCKVTASMGVCMYPCGSDDIQKLMQNADEAMYFAKKEGKDNYQFYNAGLKAETESRVEIVTQLQNALKNNEFEVFYQPKVNVKSGRVNSAEALLRWHNPYLGDISPVKFIPLAEESGQIVAIGKWVLEEAVRQVKNYQESNHESFSISVNVSPRQFLDPGLIPFIKNALFEHDVSPSLLELEITEGVVAMNPDLAIDKLNDIRSLGVKVAIDDFGTGYSSLSQLKRFPIDTLKVDRAFIKGIPKETEDMAITEAIVVMSKLLHLSVVAEGVESEEQVKFLRSIGCDEIQGFFYSRPLQVKAFEQYLIEVNKEDFS